MNLEYNSGNKSKKSFLHIFFCVRLGIEINDFALDTFFFFLNLCVYGKQIHSLGKKKVNLI